jgi:hypothetical protein
MDFDGNQVDEKLPQAARDAMLDCILAWASLDGALSMLWARVSDKPLVDAADAIGRSPATSKLVQMRAIAKEVGAHEAATILKQYKRAYETHVKIRNCIAHSRCAGVWTANPAYCVFMVFERRAGDELGIDLIPIHEMRRSTEWAETMTVRALELAAA